MPSLDALAHLCSVTISGGSGLPAILFMAGLTGGVVHCGPMCGPIVLGQVGARLAAIPGGRVCEASRVASGLLPFYHLGRITTYAALGAGVALAGGSFAPSPIARAVALMLAALLLLIAAGRRWGVIPRFAAPSVAPGVSRATGRLAAAARGLGAFPLGLALGLIPCGLIYAALSVAAVAGGPLSGGLAMAAFGLGTVPVLAVIGVAGHAAGRRVGTFARRATPFVMVANAGMLCALAIVPLWVG